MSQLTQEQSRENIRRKRAMIDSGILPRNYKDMGSNAINGNWGPWLETKYQEYLKSISKTQPLQQQASIAPATPVASALSFGRIHPALGVAAGLATAAYTNSDALQKTGDFVSNAVVPALSNAWETAKGWFSKHDDEDLDETTEESEVTIEGPEVEPEEEPEEEPEQPKNKKEGKKKSEKQKKPLSKTEKTVRFLGTAAATAPALTMGIDVLTNIATPDTVFNPRFTKKLFDVGKGVIERSGLTHGVVWGDDTIRFEKDPIPTKTDTIKTDTAKWVPRSPEAQAINDSIVKEQTGWRQQNPIFSGYGN